MKKKKEFYDVKFSFQFQKISVEKKGTMDKCRDDYENALDNFNKTQQLYYDVDFPEKVMVSCLI